MKCQKIIHSFPILFVCMLFMVPLQVRAQETIDVEPLMETGTIYWYEVSYECSKLIPQYFMQEKQDTLLALLRYWEEQTGVMEPVRRFWMLYQIHRNQFDPDFVNQIVVEDMIDYQETITLTDDDSTDWKMWGDPYVSAEFNQFTRNLAVDLLQYADLSDDEWLICLFYSHNFDEFWQLVKNEQVAHTHVYQEFQKTYKEIGLLDLHYDVFAGYYSPRKQLTKLGPKVMLGGGFGLEIERLLLDFTLLLRFMQPSDAYVVYEGGERFETQQYTGLYIGIEPAFQLYDWGQFKVDLLSGLALDIIEAVPEKENPNALQSVLLMSSNLNLGIAARYYPKKEKLFYIRGQMRYEFSGYDTDGGTELADGEALTVRLGVGWDMNKTKRRLKPYFPKD